MLKNGPLKNGVKVLFLSLMFIVLGLGTLVSEFGYHSLFGTSGERLTTRLRKLSFKKLLQLELEYFDDPMNSTGALTTRLASDAPKPQFLNLHF